MANKKDQKAERVKVNVQFDEATGFIAMSLFIGDDWTVLWLSKASAEELKKQVTDALEQMGNGTKVN